MRLILAIGMSVTLALPASADPCEGLGLRNAYLTQHFCKLLGDIRTEGATRGVGIQEADPLQPDWLEIPVLRDAYRADPRKTLELIRRIKDAGGLTAD